MLHLLFSIFSKHSLSSESKDCSSVSVIDINNGMLSDSKSNSELAMFVAAESLSSSNNVSSLLFESICSDNSVSEPSRADEDEKN